MMSVACHSSKRALDQNPDQLASMLAIATTFGDHFPDHQDVLAFRNAIRRLSQNLHLLDSRAQEDMARLELKYSKLLESPPE
jgi:hypothetical protein